VSSFPPDVLDPEEVERIYQEGRADYRRSLLFHQGPYGKPRDAATLEEYQRGYEWRRGWNDEALDDDAVNLGRPH
jgi:hypothetical protein